MLLKLALWQDVQEYLEKRIDLIIPVGSTEQHGPSGPLGTDLILAEELANDLGEERHSMVSPPIAFGVSQVHGAFPGTISLKPATLLAIVTDAIESLYQQGFRRFLLVNAHHGSKATLQAACAQVHAQLPDSRCLSVQWWELPEVRSVLMEMFGAREGHHATPGELSMVRRRARCSTCRRWTASSRCRSWSPGRRRTSVNGIPTGASGRTRRSPAAWRATASSSPLRGGWWKCTAASSRIPDQRSTFIKRPMSRPRSTRPSMIEP